MIVDINQKYTTITNLEVRFYADDGGEEMPIHGAVLCVGGWRTTVWSENGLNADKKEWNLKIKDQRIRGYMNIYNRNKTTYEAGDFFYEKKAAEEHAQGRALGYIEIDTPLLHYEKDV